MKKLIALFMVLAGAFTLAACSSDLEDAFDNNLENYSYARVEINPQIEFIVDEDDVVVSYALLNEDAEIVAAELELEGLPVDEALELFLDEAVELGYLDVDEENNITITTDEDVNDEPAEEGQEGRSLAERLSEKAQSHLQGRGIGVQVAFGDLDEELLELAEDYDIGLGRLRLIQSAVEIDEDLDYETALEMEMNDIMEILRDNHRERMEAFRNERREAMHEIRDEMRDRMRERRPDFFNGEEEDNDENNDDNSDDSPDA